MSFRTDGKPKKFTRQGYTELEERAERLERENARLRMILVGFLTGLDKLMNDASGRFDPLTQAPVR